MMTSMKMKMSRNAKWRVCHKRERNKKGLEERGTSLVIEYILDM